MIKLSMYALRNLLILSILPIFAYAQETNIDNIQEKIITDPSISRRCEELMDERKQKVAHKQRLTYLIEQAKKLKAITPPQKVSIDKKLTQTALDLIKESKLTHLQISMIEENIIRHGCPGLSL